MRQTVALNRSMKDDYHYNEAIKTLRTNIQFCGSGIRVIMMTSALPDEGKSDMAICPGLIPGPDRQAGAVNRRGYPKVRACIPVSAGG